MRSILHALPTVAKRSTVLALAGTLALGAAATVTASAASAVPASLSGKPRPGPDNTGVPEGVALKPASGRTITTAGTVLDGLDINGPIVIRASDVVIKNSRIRGTAFWGVRVESGNVTIQDSEISGFANGIAGDDWHAKRVDIHSTYQDGVKFGSRVTFEDSWIHDLNPERDAHADGGQAESGVENLMIRNNVIDVYNGADEPNMSALIIKPDFDRSTRGPVDIVDNYLNGGNCTVFVVPGRSGYRIGEVNMRDNVFGPDRKHASCLAYFRMPVSDSGNITVSGEPVSAI